MEDVIGPEERIRDGSDWGVTPGSRYQRCLAWRKTAVVAQVGAPTPSSKPSQFHCLPISRLDTLCSGQLTAPIVSRVQALFPLQSTGEPKLDCSWSSSVFRTCLARPPGRTAMSSRRGPWGIRAGHATPTAAQAHRDCCTKQQQRGARWGWSSDVGWGSFTDPDGKVPRLGSRLQLCEQVAG